MHLSLKQNKRKTMSLDQNLIFLLCVLIIFLTTNITCLRLSQHNEHHYSSTTPLFIFGDSILDAGNNNYINTTTLDKANFWPYGITFFHFPTGRFSDGRLISDFIAKHAHLPLIPPYLEPNRRRRLFSNGVNFASAGGGALVKTFQGSVIDLHMQLRNYKKVEKWFKRKFGDEKARHKLRRAVYLLSIGINDYMSLFLKNSTLSTNANSKSDYVDMVIGNITSVINDIYKTGGRKFAILNIPPAGCAPTFRNAEANGECMKELLSYVRLHNEAIFKSLKEQAISLPGFKYSLFDTYTSTFQRIKHPSKYGYREAKTACCGTGRFRGVFSCGGKRLVKQFELCNNINDHLFWDSIHFTEKTNMQIADEMWNNINYVHHYSHHVPSYTIRELFCIR